MHWDVGRDAQWASLSAMEPARELVGTYQVMAHAWCGRHERKTRKLGGRGHVQAGDQDKSRRVGQEPSAHRILRSPTPHTWACGIHQPPLRHSIARGARNSVQVYVPVDVAPCWSTQGKWLKGEITTTSIIWPNPDCLSVLCVEV